MARPQRVIGAPARATKAAGTLIMLMASGLVRGPRGVSAVLATARDASSKASGQPIKGEGKLAGRLLAGVCGAVLVSRRLR